MLSANRCGMCSVRHKVLLRFVEGRFAQDGNAATGREMSLGIVKKHSGGRGGFKGAPIIAILTIILVAAVLVSFTLGRYDMTVLDVLKVAANQLFGMETFSESTHITVVTQVRFPRVIAALVIGAALAAAGASYQGLFKNPMVSPDLLGASAGAGFGASFALLMGGNMYVVQLSAFVCGIVAVLLTYFVSTAVSKGDSMTLTLVLTGMVVTALFQAFITMTKYVADPDDKLPSITYWLMGGLSSTRIEDLPMLLAPVIVGIVPMLLFCATLVTAASVAAAGMVGWVGLVIPHLARMIVGPNHKVLLPASLLLGALYVLVIDDLCRCLFAIELPLSVLTAIIGAPFFIYLLTRGKKTWT